MRSGYRMSNSAVPNPIGLPPDGELAASGSAVNRVSIGPVSVSHLDLEGTLAQVGELARDGDHHYVCFCEANLLAHCLRDPRVAEILDQADLTLADGIAPALLARMSSGIRVPRVPGPQFLLSACDRGRQLGWRHFFYGGAPGVAQTMAERLLARYPGLEIAGVHSPPYRDLTAAEESSDRRIIEASKTDLLWVGLGGPKQEIWMADRVGSIQVPVMLGVGAAFDFHSGNRRWAPPWMRALGLEWLYRTFTGGAGTFRRNLSCVGRVGLFMLKRLVLSRGKGR
jgi:N-acetylglucosaminyldiphosphoundecaprenol N-acetyl-beta-D-mannosaminyltransferase